MMKKVIYLLMILCICLSNSCKQVPIQPTVITKIDTLKQITYDTVYVVQHDTIDSDNDFEIGYIADLQTKIIRFNLDTAITENNGKHLVTLKQEFSLDFKNFFDTLGNFDINTPIKKDFVIAKTIVRVISKDTLTNINTYDETIVHQVDTIIVEKIVEKEPSSPLADLKAIFYIIPIIMLLGGIFYAVYKFSNKK